MHQSTTSAAVPQPFPKVSHRLVVRTCARRDAIRHGVATGPAMAAADATWSSTRGDRYAARRAAWAATDQLRTDLLMGGRHERN